MKDPKQREVSEAQDELEEGTKRWRSKQKQLTQDLQNALKRYTEFHEVGFEMWFQDWRKYRRIK